MSVTASDDIEINSTSTTTDPSLTEHDLNNVDDKQMILPARSTASRPPVQLLRRQPNNPSSITSGTPPPPPPQSFRQTGISMTASDNGQPNPARVESAGHISVKETVDPALLEAFVNPMNRQYLLQLEESLYNFITQSRFGIFPFIHPAPNINAVVFFRTDTLELPPTNSFFRCLAHKMADYYKLQHVADSGHVVLFRSQFARMYALAKRFSLLI